MPLGRIGQDFIVNTEFFSRQGAPSSTTLADGRFVVTWNSFDEGDGSGGCVRGRVFNPDGGLAGDDFILNSTGDGSQNAVSVTSLVDGRFVAVWSSADLGDGSDRCIRARVFDAEGGAVDLDLIANSVAGDVQTAPVVTGLADGRFAVLWQSADTGDGSAGCIRGRLFDAGGAAVGNDFVVNSTAGNAQVLPTLTALADGRLMATWTSNDTGDGSGACVRGRIFTASGTPQGSDFIVNTTTVGSQYLSVVSPLPDGGFVAAWYSEDLGDGSLGCIRARVFNASGVATGPDFIVNSVSSGSQLDPTVATLPDGRFVIAWSSDDAGDGSGSCIRARLFNADGSAAGADFIVNTSVGGAQAVPSVTALTDGRFVVSWESDDGGEGSNALLGSCIRAQIFDSNKFVGTVGEDVWQGSDFFGDAISGGGSADVLSGLGGADQISGDAGNDTLDGGAGNDKLFGGADDDTLQGGSGADTMAGGSGNDIYLVDQTSDVVIETAGNGTSDRVMARASYTLASGADIELLTTTSSSGTTAIDLTGNALKQEIIGNYGANTLRDGPAGGAADVLKGLNGNDTYQIYNSATIVIESTSSAAGTADRVMASVDYVLKAGVGVEIMTTNSSTGTSGIDLTGNELAQAITGNAGDNRIEGREGNDTLRGLGGKDTFVFNTKLGASNVDTVVDFNVADDRFLLSDAIFKALTPGTLAATAFRANTTGLAQDADDRIIYEQDTGELYYDSNGNASGGSVLFARIAIGLSLTNADFSIA